MRTFLVTFCSVVVFDRSVTLILTWTPSWLMATEAQRRCKHDEPAVPLGDLKCQWLGWDKHSSRFSEMLRGVLLGASLLPIPMFTTWGCGAELVLHDVKSWNSVGNISGGMNPCKLKMRRWYSSCWHLLWLFITLTIYSHIPRTPAGMKQGDQSNKLIVLNLVYIMVLRVKNADDCRLGIVWVLLDILRYQEK